MACRLARPLDIGATPRFAARMRIGELAEVGRRLDGHGAVLRALGVAPASQSARQRVPRLRACRRRAPAPDHRPSPPRSPPRRSGADRRLVPLRALRRLGCRAAPYDRRDDEPRSPTGSPGSRRWTPDSPACSGTSSAHADPSRSWMARAARRPTLSSEPPRAGAHVARQSSPQSTINRGMAEASQTLRTLSARRRFGPTRSSRVRTRCLGSRHPNRRGEMPRQSPCPRAQVRATS